MFKVNNKDTRTTPLAWMVHNIHHFTPLSRYSSFFICSVHFEETSFKQNLKCYLVKLNLIYCKGYWFKVGLSTSKKVVFICFNESPLKVMKNAYYFMLKAPFVLDIFTFLSWLYCYSEKQYDKKAEVLLRHRLYNKELQYVYCPTSQEVKATRQLNLVSW